MRTENIPSIEMKMDEPYNYYASIENSKQNNVVLKYLVL
jgi:hypothetical protein